MRVLQLKKKTESIKYAWTENLQEESTEIYKNL